MQVIEKLESKVRSYVRSFPATFGRAQGARIWDRDGREYIDFFAGAGGLNYGHNHPAMKQALIDYIQADGITHSLDMATEAKEAFLARLHEVILAPRNMPHKVMFPGPTGTNAVEVAMKLARKATGRVSVVAFTNAFHGMTLGALSATGNDTKRNGSGIALQGLVRLPYDGYLGPDVDTLDLFESMIEDAGSGLDLPAAVMLETVQGEGGLNVASAQWLRRLQGICRRNKILLVVDDIQAGCGRTGPFFSFDEAGIEPDIICLSKSLSGMGLPLAIVLVKPEYDCLSPGQHNGTFRGNNHAFVTARVALDFWEDASLKEAVLSKAEKVHGFLAELARELPVEARVKGRGLMVGLEFDDPDVAQETASKAFELGLLVETAGSQDEVVKLFPPLTIDPQTLSQGLAIFGQAAKAAAQPAAKAKLGPVAA